ncbi:MAG: hypothetical protein ACRED7_11740 [Stellaceae bacterium]
MAAPVPPTALPPDPNFPGSSFPTVFADGILNFAHTAQVTKFYLYRFEPSFDGAQNRVTPFTQIVMSIDAFVNSYVLMEKGIEKLLKLGIVTQDQLNQRRKEISLDNANV